MFNIPVLDRAEVIIFYSDLIRTNEFPETWKCNLWVTPAAFSGSFTHYPGSIQTGDLCVYRSVVIKTTITWIHQVKCLTVCRERIMWVIYNPSVGVTKYISSTRRNNKLLNDDVRSFDLDDIVRSTRMKLDKKCVGNGSIVVISVFGVAFFRRDSISEAPEVWESILTQIGELNPDRRSVCAHGKTEVSYYIFFIGFWSGRDLIDITRFMFSNCVDCLRQTEKNIVSGWSLIKLCTGSFSNELPTSPKSHW